MPYHKKQNLIGAHQEKGTFNITLHARRFDGPTQVGLCGCGEVLKLDRNSKYNLSWHGSSGTNTRAKIIALWGLLMFSKEKQLHNINIYSEF